MDHPRVILGTEPVLALCDAIARVPEGRGSAWLLTGAAGMGKSTAIEAVMAHARENLPAVKIASITCTPHRRMRGGDRRVVGVGRDRLSWDRRRDRFLPSREPYQVVVDLLQQLGRLTETSPDVGRRRGMRLPPASLARFLRDMSIEFASAAVLPAPAQLALSAVRQLHAALSGGTQEDLTPEDIRRLQGRLSTVLLDAAREAPLLIVVDDAHFADAPSVEALARLAGNTPTMSAMLVIAARQVEMEEYARNAKHPLQQHVVDGLSRGWLHKIDLTPWPAPRVDEYLRGRYPGWDLPESFRALLHGRGEGHPMLLKETLDLLERRGQIATDGQGRWTLTQPVRELEIPDRLQAVIEEQLGRVAVEIRELLEGASVQGEHFYEAVLRALLKKSDQADLTRRLRAAESVYGMVRNLSSSPEELLGFLYRFSHALVRDAIYSTLPPRTQVELHRLVARELESLTGDQAEDYAAQIASHHARAGNRDEAVRYGLIAARRALDVYDGRTALDWVEEIEALPPARKPGAASPDGQWRIELIRGESLYRLRKIELATASLTKAARLAEGHGRYAEASDAWRLLSHIANVQDQREGAEQFGFKATKLAQEAKDFRRLLLAAVGYLRVVEKRSRRDPERRRIYDEVLAPAFAAVLEGARLTANRALEARALRWVGRVHRSREEWDEARRCYEPALAIARELGDPRLIVELSYSMIDIEISTGHFPQAAEMYERSVELARSIQDPYVLATVLYAFGDQLKGHGRYEDARVRLEEAVAVAERGELPEQECMARAILATLYELRGELDPAEQHHTKHREVAATIGNRHGCLAGGLGAAACRLARGDAPGALADLDTLAITEADDTEKRTRCAMTRSEALAMLGRGAEALPILDAAENPAPGDENTYWRARLLLVRARVLRLLQRRGEALEAVDRAADVLRPLCEQWKSAELQKRMDEIEAERRMLA